MPKPVMRMLVLAALSCALGGCSMPIGQLLAAPAAAGGDCLVAGAWQRLRQGQPMAVPGAAVLEWAAQQSVVLLGETHSNADHHRWQLQTLAALHLLHPDMVIGFEAFVRRDQPVLDRWMAGRLSVEQLLQRTQWRKNWGCAAELYLPLFQFARINRIPMIALNVDPGLPRAVRKHGWNAVPAAAKHGLSRPATPRGAYVDMLYTVFKRHAFAHGDVSQTDPRFRHFVPAQATWERAMAEALVACVDTDDGGKPPLVVGIMGIGHMRHGHGVPYQLRKLGISDIPVLLPVSAKTACATFEPGYANAVFALPRHATNEVPATRP